MFSEVSVLTADKIDARVEKAVAKLNCKYASISRDDLYLS
jgi:hypothetical protein